MNNESSGNGVIIGIVIAIVVLIVGWLAYKEGLFNGKTQNTPSSGVEVKVGGTSY